MYLFPMERKTDFQDLTSTVKLEAVKQIMKEHWKDQKTKINDDALRMVGEVVRLLIVESAARSKHQALLEKRVIVEMEHVEKILPKLLLDF